MVKVASSFFTLLARRCPIGGLTKKFNPQSGLNETIHTQTSTLLNSTHFNNTFNHVLASQRLFSTCAATAIASAPKRVHSQHINEVASTINNTIPLVDEQAALADAAVATAVSEDGLLCNDYSTVVEESATVPEHPITAKQLHVPSFTTNTKALQSIFKATMRSAATADDLAGGLHRDRAFFVHDLARPERQYARWCQQLPRVQPFYAVKCNPDARLLQTLRNQGAAFDCASGEEIRAALATGASPDEIIFANPVKSISDLRYASSVGVRMMTFDNDAELRKIKSHAPESLLVLRLLPDDSGSVMRFGSKFGADEADASTLLALAHQLQLAVIGTSFHIGSGCFDPTKYESAIAMCRRVHDVAHFELGMPRMTMLDIGGGFSGDTIDEAQRNSTEKGVPTFEQFADVINAALDTHFSAEEMSHVQVIAEPGRYFATSLSTLFTLIQGKRNVRKENSQSANKVLLYVNDGVYGSFNNLMFDHAKVEPLTIAQLFASEKKSAISYVGETRGNRSLLNRMTSLSSSAGLSSLPHQPIASNQLAHSRAMRHSHAASSSPALVTIFGNTCDSIDKLCVDWPMAGELLVGDWLYFRAMGAYTSAASSEFNGMKKPSNIYARSDRD